MLRRLLPLVVMLVVALIVTPSVVLGEKEKAKDKGHTGTIHKLEGAAAKFSFTLVHKGEADITVHGDTATKITKGKDPATFSDLHNDEAVRVLGKVENNVIKEATEIHIRGKK